MKGAGRTALVTGASSGIGAAFAKRLAAEGHDLILVARRMDRLEKLAEELKTRHGVEAEVLAADLTEDADLRKVAERIARAGDLEFLVNNAGFGATKAWMNSFTEGLYLDLAAIGSPVKVQALCPGYTLTEFHDASGIGRDHVPESWWISAEDVVDASLRGLARGKRIVVPGWRYKFYVFLLKALPGFLIRSLALQTRGRYRR